MEEKQTPISPLSSEDDHHQQSHNRNCRQKLGRPYEDEQAALGRSTQMPVTEEAVRNRLKRLRVETMGQVWIPDKWDQEKFMKDWIDCNAFDAALASNSKIMFARAALIEEGRRLRANSSGLRIQN